MKPSAKQLHACVHISVIYFLLNTYLSDSVCIYILIKLLLHSHFIKFVVVFKQEIIDFKMLKCHRIENGELHRNV